MTNPPAGIYEIIFARAFNVAPLMPAPEIRYDHTIHLGRTGTLLDPVSMSMLSLATPDLYVGPWGECGYVAPVFQTVKKRANGWVGV